MRTQALADWEKCRRGENQYKLSNAVSEVRDQLDPNALPLFSFSLDGEPFQRNSGDVYMLRRGEQLINAAWLSFTWDRVLDEVMSRYGEERKLFFSIEQDSAAGQEQRVWSMRHCCERLHAKTKKTPAVLEVWRREMLALHYHLHENITVCDAVLRVRR